MISRWDDWFSADNLARDTRILAASPSQSAQEAAQVFLTRGKHSVLDLACGVGRDTLYLERCGLAVVGVDASFNALRAVRQIPAARSATAHWVTADARSLPFRDGSFEGVYCFGLLHEFTDGRQQQDVAQVMAEIGRVLGDQGLLILAVLAGEPAAGLPAVQLYSRQMFETATVGWRALEVKAFDDVGCTGRVDYCVWYGVFEK
jgi:SAM-dependent methyltransferase